MFTKVRWILGAKVQAWLYDKCQKQCWLVKKPEWGSLERFDISSPCIESNIAKFVESSSQRNLYVLPLQCIQYCRGVSFAKNSFFCHLKSNCSNTQTTLIPWAQWQTRPSSLPSAFPPLPFPSPPSASPRPIVLGGVTHRSPLGLVQRMLITFAGTHFLLSSLEQDLS